MVLKRRAPSQIVTCPVCGKQWESPHPRYTLCSPECRAERRRQQDTERHGPTLPPHEEVSRRESDRIERKIRLGVGRTQVLADLLMDYVDRFPSNAIRPHAVKSRSGRHAETMVVLRSDLHPGLVTPTYNISKFRQRMAQLTERVIRIRDIISETIPIERLIIFDLGDLVTGQGIFANQSWSTEKHVLEQIYGLAAPEIIAQDLTWLEHFPEVAEYSVPGNHGRTGREYPEAVNWDNVVAQEIKSRMEKIKHFTMEPEWNWWRIVEVYGWKFLLVHGHQIRSWLNIPFYGLTQKGMRWQGSIPEGWNYLVHGHFHVPFNFPWNNFEIIGNGSLVSDDEFALRELGMNSRPAQQVFGVHPDHGITWRYTLMLD